MDRGQKTITLAFGAFFLMWVVVLSLTVPRMALADANPSPTPIPPSVTQEPTLAPPTATPETSQDEAPPPPATQTPDGSELAQSQDNAPSSSIIRSLSTVNLCLLAIAIIMLVGVTVMVIYGVIQRMSE